MNLNMHHVQQYRLLDAQGFHVNTIALADEHDWEVPSGHRLERIVPPESQPLPQLLTQLEFLRRFTSAERIAAKASRDPVVEDFIYLLTLADNVRLDDEDTIAGVRYLESIGLLGAGRSEAILTPEQTGDS